MASSKLHSFPGLHYRRFTRGMLGGAPSRLLLSHQPPLSPFIRDLPSTKMKQTAQRL